MSYVLLILVFLACILLVGVILIQSPKGNALGSGFAGQASSIIGVQKTGDVLEKITWYTIATIIVLCLLTTFAMPKSSVQNKEAVSKGAEGLPDLNNEAPAPTTLPANKPAPTQGQQPAASKPAQQQPTTKPAPQQQPAPKPTTQPQSGQ